MLLEINAADYILITQLQFTIPEKSNCVVTASSPGVGAKIVVVLKGTANRTLETDPLVRLREYIHFVELQCQHGRHDWRLLTERVRVYLSGLGNEKGP